MPNRRAAAVLVTVLALAACENNPLQVDDDHPDVNGVAFVRNGQVLARVTPAGVQGQVQVPAGGSVGIVAVVLDKDGETVLLRGTQGIQITVANPARATFEAVSAGASSGTFRGLSAGTTSFTLKVVHGSPPHTDWSFDPVPLVVTQ